MLAQFRDSRETRSWKRFLCLTAVVGVGGTYVEKWVVSMREQVVLNSQGVVKKKKGEN